MEQDIDRQTFLEKKKQIVKEKQKVALWAKKLKIFAVMVPETGLEPAHHKAYAPKAYVYTNFTTRAYPYYTIMYLKSEISGYRPLLLILITKKPKSEATTSGASLFTLQVA